MNAGQQPGADPDLCPNHQRGRRAGSTPAGQRGQGCQVSGGSGCCPSRLPTAVCRRFLQLQLWLWQFAALWAISTCSVTAASCSHCRHPPPADASAGPLAYVCVFSPLVHVRCGRYHAKLPLSERVSAHRAFQRDDACVMVASLAFGVRHLVQGRLSGTDWCRLLVHASNSLAAVTCCVLSCRWASTSQTFGASSTM